MPKNDGYSTVGIDPIAFKIFQVFDDVANQYEQEQIYGVINDKGLKVFKIKSNGKKGKYHQSGSNEVADPKQSFETAAVDPNGEDKKYKK